MRLKKYLIFKFWNEKNEVGRRHIMKEDQLRF